VLQVFGTPQPDAVSDELLAFMAATGPGVQLTPGDRVTLRALLARIECMLCDGSQEADGAQAGTAWQNENRRRALDVALLHRPRRKG